MKILVLDNYDSFTFNLVHIIRALGYANQLEVHRNDAIDLDQVDQYDKILLSPGPGIPEESGIMMDLIRQYHPTKSILGVCLGHQGIAEVFGAKLKNMEEVNHGLSMKTMVSDQESVLFNGIPSSFQSGRYHSWTVEPDSIPNELVITAKDEDHRIMGIRHQQFDVRGVQFHPESIMTEHGEKMIQNWIKN